MEPQNVKERSTGSLGVVLMYSIARPVSISILIMTGDAVNIEVPGPKDKHTRTNYSACMSDRCPRDVLHPRWTCSQLRLQTLL